MFGYIFDPSKELLFVILLGSIFTVISNSLGLKEIRKLQKLENNNGVKNFTVTKEGSYSEDVLNDKGVNSGNNSYFILKPIKNSDSRGKEAIIEVELLKINVDNNNNSNIKYKFKKIKKIIHPGKNFKINDLYNLVALNSESIDGDTLATVKITKLQLPESHKGSRNYLLMCLIIGCIFLIYSIIFLLKMVLIDGN